MDLRLTMAVHFLSNALDTYRSTHDVAFDIGNKLCYNVQVEFAIYRAFHVELQSHKIQLLEVPITYQAWWS